MPTKPVITDPKKVVARCPACWRPFVIRALGARGAPKATCSEMCHDVWVAWAAFQKAFRVLLYARDPRGERWLQAGGLLTWRGVLFALCSTRPWNEKGTKTKKARPLLESERLLLVLDEDALIAKLREESGAPIQPGLVLGG